MGGSPNFDYLGKWCSFRSISVILEPFQTSYNDFRKFNIPAHRVFGVIFLHDYQNLWPYIIILGTIGCEYHGQRRLLLRVDFHP